jgi:hypothetical protein
VTAVATSFGVIHCFGRLFTFHSNIERTLWRVASVSIIGVPIVLFLITITLGGDVFGFLLPVVCLYVLSRLVLIVLPFLCKSSARRLGKAFKVGQQEAGGRFDLERESAQLRVEAFKVGDRGEVEVRRADKSLEVARKCLRRWEMGFYEDRLLYASSFGGLYTFCEHLKRSLK